MGRFAEDIAFDPQTSGGLLLAIPPREAEEVAAILRENGFAETALLGRFIKGEEKLILK